MRDTYTKWVINMAKTNHSELAKHLPPDFFSRKITGGEFMSLLASIRESEDPAHQLLKFLEKHGFEVEKI